MTAYFAVPYADRIEMMADGACCDPQGVLLEAVTKIWSVPGKPVALTARGALNQVKPFCDDAIAAFIAAPTIDQALVKLSDTMPIHPAILYPWWFEVVIAAMSESMGPTLWYYSNHRTDGPLGSDTVPPMKLIRWQGIAAGGSGLDEHEVAALGVARHATEKGAKDLGMKLMEAWRRKAVVPRNEPDGPAVHGVGCHVDHATVSAAGVVIERIHTWPDDIGRPIQP